MLRVQLEANDTIGTVEVEEDEVGREPLTTVDVNGKIAAMPMTTEKMLNG